MEPKTELLGQDCFCPSCGKKVGAASQFCLHCGAKLRTAEYRLTGAPAERPVAGETVPANENAPLRLNLGGTLSCIATVIASVLQTLSFILLVIFALLHALALDHQLNIPASELVDTAWWTSFLYSLYPMILAGILAAIFLLSTILVNMKRLRRALLSVGVSSIAAGTLIIILKTVCPLLLSRISDDLPERFLMMNTAFGRAIFISSIAWMLFGAFLIIIYSGIQIRRAAAD